MEGVLVGPGTVLAGRYTLEREVGRGGMATVYLARDSTAGSNRPDRRLDGCHGKRHETDSEIYTAEGRACNCERYQADPQICPDEDFSDGK